MEHTYEIKDTSVLGTLDVLRLPLSLKLVDAYTLLCGSRQCQHGTY